MTHYRASGARTYRISGPVNLPEPRESTRTLSKTFNAITSSGTGFSVRCTRCKVWGRINPRLRVYGEKFVCGDCRVL